MTSIYLINKKGEKTQVQVTETVEEVWGHITWQQPDEDYNSMREVFNKDFVKLTTKDTSPIVISKRFIYYIE